MKSLSRICGKPLLFRMTERFVRKIVKFEGSDKMRFISHLKEATLSSVAPVRPSDRLSGAFSRTGKAVEKF